MAQKIISNVFLMILMVLAPLNAFAVTQWAKSSLPASGDNLTAWPTAVNAQWSIVDTLVSNYRRGYTLSYSSGSTLVASSGEIVVSNSGGTVRLFLADTSSTNITFANIDTGAEASATTYYVYCGANSATASACTFYLSTSSTAPSGITYYARLGSIYNDASSNITRINNDNVTNEIGEKESKTDGVTYQAATDGYFVGLIDAGGSTGSYGDIIGYTDNSSSPTTVMGYASGWRVDSTFSASTGNRKNSFIFPVKAGDYYKGSSSTTGSVTVTFYFVPKN